MGMNAPASTSTLPDRFRPLAAAMPTGYEWELAPCATDCCGSGGVYNLQKPDNAREIRKRKSAFLGQLPEGVRPILATSNHACTMQWNSARAWTKRSFEVKHIIQLLDPV